METKSRSRFDLRSCTSRTDRQYHMCTLAVSFESSDRLSLSSCSSLPSQRSPSPYLPLVLPAQALECTHSDPTTRVGLQYSPHVLGQRSDGPSNYSRFDDEGFRDLGCSRVSRGIDELDLMTLESYGGCRRGRREAGGRVSSRGCCEGKELRT